MSPEQVGRLGLVTFVQSLNLTTAQKEELVNLLDEKYMASGIKAIDNIYTA